MNPRINDRLAVMLGAWLFGSMAGCALDGTTGEEDEESAPASWENGVDGPILVELNARAGERFELDGRNILAPPPGTSLFSETLYETGESRILHLRSETDGRVFLVESAPHLHDEDGDVVQGQSAAGETSNPDAPAPCSTTAYATLGFRWKKTLKWKFNDSTTPSGLSKTDVAAKLKRAASNITGSKNSCNLADEVSATHRYLGTTTAKAQIDGNGDCTGDDGANVVSFGTLPSGTHAKACYNYTNDGAAISADMKLNKASYTWTTTPGSSSCSNRWSIEAVATHEWGHAFGLGHVSESSHGNQTMSPSINGSCQNSEATLGAGDVAGLRDLY
ncbi:MAG: matrixin family metalloprotease [Polyangiaceae bacterium]